MRKVIPVVIVGVSLGMAACAAFRHPSRGRTMETRPIAPGDLARIQAAADAAHTAALEQQARLQERSDR